jgi:hypothetical protein
VTAALQKLRKDGKAITMNLALALIVSQLLFITGVDRTGNLHVCQSVTIALHYWLLVSFMVWLPVGCGLLHVADAPLCVVLCSG